MGRHSAGLCSRATTRRCAMDLNLSGKRALVTGSTSGIGFATALRLAREGVEVVVNGRTGRRGPEASARMRAQGQAATVLGAPADLSGAEGVGQVTRRVPE